ncbi:MAG: MoxR family ATPase [Planctomycetota bacterium]|nr:MAG: MoxR family ATPase [Planctomycetota bacterium]
MSLSLSLEEKKAIPILKEKFDHIQKELKKKIVGQERVLNHCFIAIFSGGHCLLAGVPGVGKTLVVQSLGELLSLKFSRIQFTPDLMPSDIVGTQIITIDETTKEKRFKFLRGPIFTNLFLADELNRTPPKTQAALMEAMEEKQVSLGGEKQPLPKPFFTMATQNFVEQEGIYPLPFAQLDRFMFELALDYPSEDEEMKILELTTTAYKAELEPVLVASEILKYMEMVRKVEIDDSLVHYAITLARSTRPGDELATEFAKQWIECGASPRAPYYMILGAKAWAMLQGRSRVILEDILYVARAVLEHRIILSYHAQVEKISPSSIVSRLIEEVPKPGRKKWRFFPFLSWASRT